MKLEKVTEKAGRKYYDACGAAHGLDLIGERWALLVIRELMMGPRRFGDLRKDLHGISANVLTQRLEGLEASGILRRRKLPPPASVQVYELTPWGYQSETAIQELGRWAARSPDHDTTLPLSAASIMLSFRTMISAERAAGLSVEIAFLLGPEQFLATIEDGGIVIRRGGPEGAAATFVTDPVTLASVVYGGRRLADAEAAGTLRITGDREIAERLSSFFVLPPKAP